VVDSLVSGDVPSTKAALTTLTALTDRARYLVVLERSDATTWLSLRNAPQVHIVAVDQLNTYDVLAADDVVFTKGAYDTFVNGTSAGGSTAATAEPKAEPKAAKKAAPKTEKAAEPEVAAFAAVADDAPADEAPALPKGAKAPLKSGNAPKGYDIKGNADSGLYHEPEGQWYDATEAEFWFKTAEDAEAAGFKRAGGGSAATTVEDDK